MVPTDISGCKLWLDASDSATITIVSGLVTRWYDKSAWGQYCVNDQDVQNTNTLNGKKVITCTRVSGKNNSMRAKVGDGNPAWVLNSSNNTFIFLQRRLSTALSNGCCATFYKNGESDTFGANCVSCFYGTSNYQWRRWYGVDQMTVEHTVPYIDSWGITCLVRDSGTATAYVGNVSIASDTYSDTSVITPDSFVLSNVSGTDAASSNEYAEVIVYDSALSAVDRTNIYNYLQNKWIRPNRPPVVCYDHAII